MKATLRSELLLTLLPFGALAGCQGSELRAPPPPILTTRVEPAAVTAGQSAAVICELGGTSRRFEPADFTVSYAPLTGRDGGVVVAGRVVTGEGAGTYTVHCGLAALGLVDDVGALFTVNAGDAASTRPVFEENPIAARVPTAAICEVVDDFGNAVPIESAEFFADPSLAFSGGNVTGTLAGEWPVTCAPPGDTGSLRREEAALTVVPGSPVSVDLVATPERDLYPANAVVTLSWVAYDLDDNPIEGLPGTIATPGAPVATRVTTGAERYRLGAGDGRYRFVLTLDPPAPGLQDSLELIVDTTPPTITVTYPPRGATIRATDAPVEVRGVVTDAIGVTSLTINGEDAEIAADGTFSHPVSSKWGLNNLVISARDIGRNSSLLTPTYQYSDRWISFIDEDARGIQQPDSAVVLLGQDFFDDGERNPPAIDDMAALIETVLGNAIDLKALLDPALAGLQIPSVPLDGFEQRIDLIPGLSWVDLTFNGAIDFTFRAADSTGTGPVFTTIDSRDGGLDMDIGVGDDTAPAVAIDLELEIAARFNVEAESCSILGCIPNPPGTATAGAIVTARIAIDAIDFSIATDISKAYEQPMEIAFTRLDTVIGAIQVLPIDDVNFFIIIEDVPALGDQVFELPLSSFFDIGAIFDALITPFATQLANLLPSFINPLIRDNVGPILAGLFDLLVIDTLIPVPPLSPAAEPIDIGFSTELSTVDFTDDGGTVGIASGLHTKKKVERDPLGAIVRGDCIGASTEGLTWGWDPSVGIGLTLDLGNAALFTAWWGNLLNGPLDLSALTAGGGGGGLPIPVDGLALELNWLLPPIFNDCDPDNGYVEIGDLGVKLVGNLLGLEVSADMYSDFRLSVAYETRPDGLYVVLGDVLETEFEVITLDDGGLGEIFDIRSLIVDALPGLLGSFLAGQSIGPIALPPTDLSTLLPGLPVGTTFGLGNLQVRNQDGYVVIGGDLE